MVMPVNQVSGENQVNEVNGVISGKDSNFTSEPNVNAGNYAKIRKYVEQWLVVHRGETFDLDTICRQLEIQQRENRNYVAVILSKLVAAQKLEKNNKIYIYIDKSIKYIDWVNASDTETLDIIWPYGHEDESQFGFDGRVVVSPGDLIVIAGVSNMGKTTFCLNFLWENMDRYPCVLMGNEYAPGKFKRRIKRMNWANPLKEDGTPKFELIDRTGGWKDIIVPDAINIIDWINLEDKFYQIGSILEGIRSKLHNGIALVSIQKDAHKGLGLGGGFSQHLASLYLSIDFNRMTVVKAKEWREWNPNGKVYGFEIIDGGTKFHHIRLVKKCFKCHGTGETRSGKCEDCLGTGWVDDISQDSR